LINFLNGVFHIEEKDSSEKIRGKIESGIKDLIGKSTEMVPYVGNLYALTYPELEDVSAELWKNRLEEAMKEILTALAKRAPTVFFLEDLHWADRSFVELLHRALLEIRQPAIVLCVYRPNFSLFTSHQLSSVRKLYREIRLQDLSLFDAQDMLASLLKTEDIPSELKRWVQDKTEGNPFYLEELVNTLIESEVLIRQNGDWKITRPIKETDISSSIHGLISGRVDRLEKETKRILQEASVIGRAFLWEILKRITDIKENIDRSLNGLEQLDLIRTRSFEPELEYIFKHALTQEVVYNGLLKKERRAIHERIGLVMEQLFQGRLSEFYETLAFHFKQGLSILKAVHYLMKSGEKSLKRYAVEESHQYYKEAFDLLAKKPVKTKEEQEILIDLIIEWAYVFNFRGAFKQLYDLVTAHEGLAECLDDKARLGMLYVWLGMSAYLGRARHRTAYQYLCSALKLGEESENLQVIGYATGYLTWVCAELGLLEEGISFGEKAQEIAKLLPPDPFLQDLPLNALGYLYWHKGETKKVFKYGKDLLDNGERNSDIRSLVWGWWITGLACVGDGNLQSAIRCMRKGLQIYQEPYYRHLVKIALGAIYAYRGQFQEAEETLQQAVAYSREYGVERIGITARMYLGAALIGKGQMGRGLELIEQAQGLFLENDDKGFYAVSEHILGKVYLQIVERAAPMTLSTIAKNIGFLIRNVPFASKKAEYHFKKAIEVTEEHGFKGFQGQAYLDLGLLHKVKGRRDQARECISASIELFEQCEAEGFLKQAKEALASLR
jgi:tetratricopeptide (TPR) repeat protein